MGTLRAGRIIGALISLISATCLSGCEEQKTDLEPEKQVFRITLDTGPNHVRNIMVDQFVKRLEKTTADKLDIQVFHSSQIAKGRDVPKAMIWGTAHMGVLAMPHIARYAPDANLFGMPIFYGRGPEYSRAVADGEIGDTISRKLEKKLRVKVLSPYLELGTVITFTTKKKMKTPAAYSGMKIRAPGGASSVARLSALGANAIGLPFSDVPLALNQGAMDGVSSTYETIRSAKLWQSGLSYSFEDNSEVLFYVPMISNRFWESAPIDIQRAIQESWRGAAQDARVFAVERQLAARREFVAAGGVVNTGSAPDLKKARDLMSPSTERIARSLDMDINLLKDVETLLLEMDRSAIEDQR